MRTCLIILLASFSCVSIAGHLPVIATQGATIPVAPYIAAAHLPVMNMDINTISSAELAQISQPPNNLTLDTPLPKTDMTPGIEATRNVDLPWLSMPIFLVGSDEQSLEWLRSHQVDLIKMHAQGILINAQNHSDINNLRNSFSDLSIVPLSANMIADRLGIKHYPVLITKMRIMQ